MGHATNEERDFLHGEKILCFHVRDKDLHFIFADALSTTGSFKMRLLHSYNGERVYRALDSRLACGPGDSRVGLVNGFPLHPPPPVDPSGIRAIIYVTLPRTLPEKKRYNKIKLDCLRAKESSLP